MKLSKTNSGDVLVSVEIESWRYGLKIYRKPSLQMTSLTLKLYL